MNIRNTTAKERMLKNIRQALLVKREQPHIDFEDSPLYPDEEDPLDVTFAREFTAAGGNFVYCDGEISVIENLILLAEELKIKNIHVWESSLQQFLDEYAFPIYKTPYHLEGIEASITTCEALVARNGSVVVSNGNASGRPLSIYAPIHIVMAKASQLVMDVKHGLQKVNDKYRGHVPSMLSVITGPSLSAAIENTAVVGAHGPKALYVFLVEDRF